MQEENPSIIENDSSTAELVVPETPANSSNIALADPVKKPQVKKPIIISAGVISLAAVAFGAVYFFNHREQTPVDPVEPVPEIVPHASADEAAKPKYTLERDENGDYELFGSDDTKNNSGEAFVEYQNAISNAQDSSSSEIFEAKLAKVIYYTAMEFFDEAEAELGSIDTTNITAEQQSRYDEVAENLESSKSGANLEDR